MKCPSNVNSCLAVALALSLAYNVLLLRLSWPSVACLGPIGEQTKQHPLRSPDTLEHKDAILRSRDTYEHKNAMQNFKKSTTSLAALQPPMEELEKRGGGVAQTALPDTTVATTHTSRTGVLPTTAPAAPEPVASITPGAKNLRERWYSEACFNFFERKDWSSAWQGPPRPDFYAVPQRTVREDFCKRGRGSGSPGHAGLEVTILDDFKIIYLEVRKSGSSLMKGVLTKLENVDSWRSCGKIIGAVPPACGFKANRPRCSSLCLLPAHHDYFVFTLVREPMSRAFSSFHQALRMRQHGFSGSQVMYKDLGQLLNGTCRIDQHYETQAEVLSTALGMREGDSTQFELPLDYIGRLENIQDDMREVMAAATRKTGIQISAKIQEEVLKMVTTKHQNEGGELIPKEQKMEMKNDPALLALIKSAYAQDFACFGNE